MSDSNPSPKNTGTVKPNGPLVLNGRILHSAPAGAPAQERAQAALCRCGHSRNKPFCDGSHNGAGFADAGLCARPPETSGAPAEGALALNPVANGPLRVDGWFELTAADGTRHVCGEKTWLCRCGASGNKPFCDGTHKKIGFTA
jgi:CDGSH-type Zn-finger protein